MNSKTNEHSAEQLIKNIQKLMAEVEEIIASSGETVSQEASSKLEELQNRLSSATDAVKGYYNTARKRVVAGAQVADDTIRTHPYESLAVALGLGVVLGAL